MPAGSPMPQRPPTLLVLVAVLGLICPASVRSELPNPDPTHVFEVRLADTSPIQLSPRIHFLAPKDRDLVICFDCMRDLKPASFTFSLNQDDWTLVPIGNPPEVWFFD